MDEKTEHPTQKPEELTRRFIAASSNEGTLVVDPFVGSGTTNVIAERLGRRWVAGDRDPRFVGLARERLLRTSSKRPAESGSKRPARA